MTRYFLGRAYRDNDTALAGACYRVVEETSSIFAIKRDALRPKHNDILKLTVLRPMHAGDLPPAISEAVGASQIERLYDLVAHHLGRWSFDPPKRRSRLDLPLDVGGPLGLTSFSRFPET